MAGRRGPPVLQLYYDLARLWRKERRPEHPGVAGLYRGPGRRLGGAGGRGAAHAARPGGRRLSFKGDVLLLIYLLALARFCTAWAALETGSAFEGMGAAREVSYAVLSEAALITAVLS